MNNKIELYLYEFNAEVNQELIKKYIKSELKKQAYIKWNDKELEVEVSPRGKPYFPHSNQHHFNISYTNGSALIGLSDNQIGVDIEYIKTINWNLVKRFYSESEKKYIQDVVPETSEVMKRYYEIWTKKEAYVKYLGTGIDKNFRNIDVFDLKEDLLIESYFFNDYVYSICLKNHISTNKEEIIINLNLVKTKNCV